MRRAALTLPLLALAAASAPVAAGDAPATSAWSAFAPPAGATPGRLGLYYTLPGYPKILRTILNAYHCSGSLHWWKISRDGGKRGLTFG